MNSDLITQAHRATLAGGTPFPQIVAQLIEAGVESYHVDYLALTTTFHDGVGAAVTTTISYESLPPVAHDFDEASLVANIRDSQQKNQHYRDFTTRAMNAGVAGYHAFLRGRRVTYYGRQGDQHTEWFPGD
jgi:uncharacterized protein YbcV (DUF1398 family)